MFKHGTRIVRRYQDRVRIGAALLVIFSIRLAFIRLLFIYLVIVYLSSVIGRFPLDVATLYKGVHVLIYMLRPVGLIWLDSQFLCYTLIRAWT